MPNTTPKESVSEIIQRITVQETAVGTASEPGKLDSQELSAKTGIECPDDSGGLIRLTPESSLLSYEGDRRDTVLIFVKRPADESFALITLTPDPQNNVFVSAEGVEITPDQIHQISETPNITGTDTEYLTYGFDVSPN